MNETINWRGAGWYASEIRDNSWIETSKVASSDVTLVEASLSARELGLGTCYAYDSIDDLPDDVEVIDQTL